MCVGEGKTHINIHTHREKETLSTVGECSTSSIGKISIPISTFTCSIAPNHMNQTVIKGY